MFSGRFVTVLRAWAAIFAGTASMDPTRFAVADTGGAVLWAGICTTASYLAGNALTRTSGPAAWVLVGLGLIVLGTSSLLVRRREWEPMIRAEAAYPD